MLENVGEQNGGEQNGGVRNVDEWIGGEQNVRELKGEKLKD